MNNDSEFSKKSNTPELTEKQIQEVKRIKDVFEGSIVSIEPVIPDSKQKEFKSAYTYIMRTFKPLRNIKPCIAYILVNGLSDGWRINAPGVAYECLRIYDFDLNKAWELLNLYYENSKKTKNRTTAHLKGALKWVLLHRDFKLSCGRLSKEIPCIGDKEVCYKMRGISNRVKGGSNMELLENQKALYLRRFIDYGYNLRLSKRATDIYFFLLQKCFETGFDTLYIAHRELARSIGDYQPHIGKYLKELKKVNLIAYKPGSEKGTVTRGEKKRRIASEIKIIDITGRAESRTEALFKKLLKN